MKRIDWLVVMLVALAFGNGSGPKASAAAPFPDTRSSPSKPAPASFPTAVAGDVIVATQYAVHELGRPGEARPEIVPGAQARNPAHGLAVTVAPTGLRISLPHAASEGKAGLVSEWRLESLGRGGSLLPVPTGELCYEGERIELSRAESPARLTEWFVNTPGGLEHGFTLYERPIPARLDGKSSTIGAPLQLILSIGGNLTPQVVDGGQRLELRDPEGKGVLSYEKLRVWDARGTELPATMGSMADRVTLTVDDSVAEYPITVDPTFVQEAYLKASNSDAYDFFGFSVAISGDTVIVGAPGESSASAGVNGNQADNSLGASGAAYIFRRTGNVWVQEAYLKASNPGESDGFGASVSISGDIAVVGAPFEASAVPGVNGNQADNSARSAGAAYVFRRTGNIWIQEAYLKASNPSTYAWFGSSVAIDGTTIIVGAPSESSAAMGVNAVPTGSALDSGAAYVFRRTDGIWRQEAYLKASNTDTGDFFGLSVSISGNTAVVGAPYEDSAATGIDGNQLDNTARERGAAYVFARRETTWRQDAYVKPPEANHSELFGGAVAIDGDWLLIGSGVVRYPFGNGTFLSEEDGVVFFSDRSSRWQSESNPSFMGFQVGAVALSANRTLIGSAWAGRAWIVDHHDPSGVPYHLAFSRADSGWFGWSVGLSGNLATIGAPLESGASSGINGDPDAGRAVYSGAVYLYREDPRGQIIVQVDLAGVREQPGTWVQASRPAPAFDSRVILPAPYSGTFRIEHLPPTSTESPAQPYRVQAALNLRSGRRFESFLTPTLGEGANPGVSLPERGVVDLGDTFVMNPTTLAGRIHVQGPPDGLLGHPSPLQQIVRLEEPGADYSLLPDNIDSRVQMQGKDELAPGATYSAAGARARASFAGDFDPATGSFDGDYELLLAGLNGQPAVYDNLALRLVIDSGSPANPDTFAKHVLNLTELIGPGYNQRLDLAPGSDAAVDLNYCLSEVILGVSIPSGTLWNPTVEVLNSGFNSDTDGPDFQGNHRWYQAELRNVVGTPSARGVGAQGRVVVLLPQGTHRLRISAQVEDAAGTVSTRQFEPFELRVGCGEKLQVASGLHVALASLTGCGSDTGHINGTVLAPDHASIRRIWWQDGAGAEHTICETCGADPVFNFDLPLAGPCRPTAFAVYAEAADGRIASVAHLFEDTLPPVLTVGPDRTLSCSTVWDFDPATAVDACNGPVAPEMVSTTRTIVGGGRRIDARTWRATDACGNSIERTQRVTVVDTEPPRLECTDLLFGCPQRVTYPFTATDNCGTPQVTYDPPSGSFFGRGTTPVHCIAVDSCGLSTECTFQVTVLEACPQHTYFGGTAILPRGPVEVTSRADGSIALAGIPAPGIAGGIRFDVGDAESLRFDFIRPPMAAPTPPGAVLGFEAIGEAGTALAGLHLERRQNAAVFEVIPDFRPLGANQFGARFYDGERLILEVRGRTAQPVNSVPFRNQILLTIQPTAVRASIRPGEGLVYEYALVGGEGVQVYQDGLASNINPTRIEFFPDGAGIVGPSCLTGMEVTVSGADTREIEGMVVSRFGQEIRASAGVLLGGGRDELVIRPQTKTPTLPFPAVASPFSVLATPPNPVGYFGDFVAGNPSRYVGYWEGRNPLGIAGDWDVLIDLTDRAAQPLGSTGYRPGKSSVEWRLGIPSMVAGGSLRVVAGGARNALPATWSGGLGTLLFARAANADRVGISVEPDSPGSQIALEATLPNGRVLRFAGTGDPTRVEWEAAACCPVYSKTAIEADNQLTWTLRPSQDGPFTLTLPDGSVTPVSSLRWRIANPDSQGARSLRGILLVGSQLPEVRVGNVVPLTDNPVPPSFFGGRAVRALGRGTLRHDAFGSLEVNGLSPSGEDGVAFDAFGPAHPDDRVALSLGVIPVEIAKFPESGASLGFQLEDVAGHTPNAVLFGKTRARGGEYGFDVRFPGLKVTQNTLRLFRGDAVAFEQTGRPEFPAGRSGNVFPSNPPERVELERIDGHLRWRMSWNRPIAISVFNQFTVANPILADRVEFTAEDGNPLPGAGMELKILASQVGSLRLLPPIRPTSEAVPPLNFAIDGSRLRLNWQRDAINPPKLVVGPTLNGPWRNAGLGQSIQGQRDYRIDLGEDQLFTRLVAAQPSEGCLEFNRFALSPQGNPFEVSGWTFERFSNAGQHELHNEVVEFDGNRALVAPGILDIHLPSPAASVDLGFIRFGNHLKLVAYDDAGVADEIDRDGAPETGRTETVTFVNRGRPLTALRIFAAGQPMHVRELCLQPFPSGKPLETRDCLPLHTAPIGPVGNPWVQGAVTFTSLNADGETADGAQISLFGAGTGHERVGYEVQHTVELKFEVPCPEVSIEFLSNSGLVEFRPFDDLGAPLTPVRYERSSAVDGETVSIREGTRPIQRVLVVTPNDRTRILRVCCGPVPTPFCREIGDLAVRPTRNPQPVGDTVWTFYNLDGGLGASALISDPASGRTGLLLGRETVVEFTTDQTSVELEVLVDASGARLSAEATSAGGRTAASLPEGTYAAGWHQLRLDDYCPTTCGGTIRRVRVKLVSGKVIATRLCTQERHD